jgi:hypothetical protein
VFAFVREGGWLAGRYSPARLVSYLTYPPTTASHRARRILNENKQATHVTASKQDPAAYRSLPTYVPTYLVPTYLGGSLRATPTLGQYQPKSAPRYRPTPPFY